MLLVHCLLPLGLGILLVIYDELWVAALSFLVAAIGFKEIYIFSIKERTDFTQLKEELFEELKIRRRKPHKVKNGAKRN